MNILNIQGGLLRWLLVCGECIYLVILPLQQIQQFFFILEKTNPSLLYCFEILVEVDSSNFGNRFKKELKVLGQNMKEKVSERVQLLDYNIKRVHW